MKHFFYLLLLVGCIYPALSQTKLEKLTVEKIMRDPKWIGTSPSAAYWSNDGKYLFFKWNPEKAISDSLYYITKDNPTPRKAPVALWQNSINASAVQYNLSRTAYTYSKDGDIFLTDIKTGKEKRITQTVDNESDPVFSFNDTKIVYNRNQNLFAWDIASGLTTQLTNFQKGTAPAQEAKPINPRRMQGPPKDEKKEPLNTQEKWLQNDQLQNFSVLKSRKDKRDLADSLGKLLPKPKELKSIYTEEKNLNDVAVSPGGRFITYRLYKPASDAKNTIVPNYVTETGFTQDIPGRSKVGVPQGSYEFFVFDAEKDTVIAVKPEQIPGINDLPDYAKDYPSKDTAKKKPATRSVIINGPYWSDKGTHAMLDIRSIDNKDRWLMLLDGETGKLKLIDRQRDEAWVGGPGVGYFFGGIDAGWIDENTFWYQSESSGYSHIYSVNVNSDQKTTITTGKYEVQQAQLSKDKKYFFITTNEVHPGEQQFYRLPVSGGKAERITTLTGANQVTVSPDEKQIAILYSYSNKPWELYLQENKPGTKAQQITFQAVTDEFKSYPWRDPELITITASDGATVYARLYRPAVANPAKPDR